MLVDLFSLICECQFYAHMIHMPYANFCPCRCSSKFECVTSLSGSYCNAYNYMWMSYEPSCALMMQYFRLFVRHILLYLLVATAIRCNTSELVLASLWSRHRAGTPVNKCPEILFSGFQRSYLVKRTGFSFRGKIQFQFHLPFQFHVHSMRFVRCMFLKFGWTYFAFLLIDLWSTCDCLLCVLFFLFFSGSFAFQLFFQSLKPM